LQRISDDGQRVQARGDLEIPGSHLRCAPE
jgi:hypothetical protein